MFKKGYSNCCKTEWNPVEHNSLVFVVSQEMCSKADRGQRENK